MEEALIFWKTSFARRTPPEKFDKQYAYNIRHNYGKEGKRVDYTAYNCLKIITSGAPGPSDSHGCPFKIMEATVLKQHLDNWGVSGEHQEKVLELAKSHQYDRACSRYFEFQHGLQESSLNQLITHPNQFFDESRKIRTANRQIAASGTNSETMYEF